MEILFEDNHIIAVNKSVSDIVQRDKTGDESLEEKVKKYIKVKYNKPGEAFLGVVHRLDRPVSGVVLFARTSKSLERLNQMFQERQVKKIYWAIVKNRPSEDQKTLTHYIVRNTQSNKSLAYDKEVPGSKKAILHYKILTQSDQYFLIEVELETGRHHQIRSQLTKIGSPIKGDLKYGFPRSNPDGGISLHSRSISFEHPITKSPINIIASPPEDRLWSFFIHAMKI